MKKIHLLFLLLICSASLSVFAQTPSTGTGNSKKIVLPSFDVVDDQLETAVSEVCEYIYKKKSGFKWPMTKVTFCKQDPENLLIDVTAIDNSWCKLFDPREDVYGYFIMKNRMFVVCSKGENQVDMDSFFQLDDDASRKFDTGSMVTPVFNNPTWYFQYKDNKLTLLKAENLQVLEN